MFHWCLDCPTSMGIPREKHAVIVTAILSHDFAIEVRFSHVISLIYIDISESGNGHSQVGNPRAQFVGFSQHMYFCGGFDVKWAAKYSYVVKFTNIYIFSFFFYHLLQLALCRVFHCSRALSPRFLLLKTPALQSHVRPEFLISDGIVNLCTLMYSKVKTRCEIGGLNCSGYTFWSIDRCDTNAIQPRKILETDPSCTRNDGWKIHQVFCHIWSK